MFQCEDVESGKVGAQEDLADAERFRDSEWTTDAQVRTWDRYCCTQVGAVGTRIVDSPNSAGTAVGCTDSPWVGILALVRATIEVPTACPITISSRAVVILHRAPEVVWGSLAALVLENRLREGRRSGRIDSRIGGRVLTIAVEALPGQI